MSIKLRTKNRKDPFCSTSFDMHSTSYVDKPFRNGTTRQLHTLNQIVGGQSMGVCMYSIHFEFTDCGEPGSNVYWMGCVHVEIQFTPDRKSDIRIVTDLPRTGKVKPCEMFRRPRFLFALILKRIKLFVYFFHYYEAYSFGHLKQ